MTFGRLKSEYKEFITKVEAISTPNNIHEALRSTECRKAVFEEYNALEKNNTWSLVKLPIDHRTMSYKWLFTPKFLADGSIELYKARLVARGFTQTYRMDYT